MSQLQDCCPAADTRPSIQSTVKKKLFQQSSPCAYAIDVHEKKINTNIHSDSCKYEFKIPASHHPAVSAPENPFNFMDISPPAIMGALTS
jgi:hypothetical protein